MLSIRSARNLALAAVIGLSPVLASAQNQSQFTAFQGLQGTLGIQSGNYNFQTFDKGRLQEIALNQAIKMQDADRSYILSTTTALEVMMNGLVANVINGTGGLQAMADQAAAQALETDLTNLLAAYRNYNTQIVAVQNRMVSIMALPGGVKVAKDIKLEDSGVVQLREGGQIDLSPVITHYKTQLAQIEATVNSIVFPKVILANGTPVIGKTLKEIMAVLAQQAPYTQDQIKAKIAEVTQLRFIDTQSRNQINVINDVTRQLLNSYVYNFGVDQRWRINMTPEERVAIFKDLEEVFWARSLLRALNGVGLGAIGIQYNTSAFNADVVFSSSQLQFISLVTSPQKINEQRRLLLLALQTMDFRNDKVLEAETPFFNKILSGVEFIKGTRQLADVNVEVLKLLYADMVEESVIAQDGFMGMRTHYQTRYYTGQTDADVAAIKARAVDWRNPVTLSSVDTPRGAFYVAKNILEAFRTNLDKADKIQAEIDLFQAGSPIFKKFKDLDDSL